eukprot:151034-Hanusia_phi.AAC.1
MPVSEFKSYIRLFALFVNHNSMQPVLTIRSGIAKDVFILALPLGRFRLAVSLPGGGSTVSGVGPAGFNGSAQLSIRRVEDSEPRRADE